MSYTPKYTREDAKDMECFYQVCFEQPIRCETLDCGEKIVLGIDYGYIRDAFVIEFIE